MNRLSKHIIAQIIGQAIILYLFWISGISWTDTPRVLTVIGSIVAIVLAPFVVEIGEIT